MRRLAAAAVVSAMLVSVAQSVAAASDLSGRVLFSGVPVPGATVTLRQSDRTRSTTSDQEGAFRFAGLDDGAWSIRVEMRGFVVVSREVALPLAAPLTVALTMQSYDEMVKSIPAPAAVPDVSADAAGVSDLNVGVINGSVINGAATPFAQPRAFGNNRPSLGAKYTGSASAVLGNSALNARPFSFSAASVPAPSYADARFEFVLGGPLRIPWLVKNGPQFLLAFRHGVTHTETTQSALMPTAAERAGDFAESPLVVRDPLTGLPFAGNVIPAGRITPQAAALVAYYPLPNASSSNANYQQAILTATTTDQIQFATTKTLTRHTTLGGTLGFQRSATNTTGIFGFADATRQSSVAANLNWTRRFTATKSLRLRYQFSASGTTVLPFFAGRTNVSGDAGIGGNSQDAADWGPPAVSFPDVASLTDADYQRSRERTNAGGAELQFKHGRHEVTIGSDARLGVSDVLAQADPRGTLAFTGAASGDAFADFLLGLPATSTIGFGNETTRFSGRTYDAYVNDDWRLSGLTLTLGARWEYETPYTGTAGQLRGALRPDRRGLEPRLGASWRPFAASSFVIRGSYGIYRNLGLYEPLAVLQSEQPPFSRTFSVQSNAAAPLTLANPFPDAFPTAPTFVVDSSYRAGYAHTWQVTAQRDLPASLTGIVSYLGAKGSHLPQASLPNTYPAGAVNPCPGCPAGFVLLTSGGESLRNAAQFTLRRRLHDGLTASAQYTLSKSTDDTATFSNTTLTPKTLAIAQDWRDLSAERGPSSFDQRHLLSTQVDYTTGVGAAGGTLVDNVWGTIFKDWTMTAQMTAGSGLPFTPLSFVAIAGTGVVGVRPHLTGASIDPIVAGSYANAAAFAAPIPGQWGDAGRNSIRGPAQFSLDGSVARVFRLPNSRSVECRVDAANLLNRVTFSTINTIVSSPQFGLPTLANPMRRLQVTARFRF